MKKCCNLCQMYCVGCTGETIAQDDVININQMDTASTRIEGRLGLFFTPGNGIEIFRGRCEAGSTNYPRASTSHECSVLFALLRKEMQVQGEP